MWYKKSCCRSWHNLCMLVYDLKWQCPAIFKPNFFHDSTPCGPDIHITYGFDFAEILAYAKLSGANDTTESSLAVSLTPQSYAQRYNFNRKVKNDKCNSPRWKGKSLPFCPRWVDSAANDSPYWSLNTALLASQPYTRRSRISRLAPVLEKMLSSYIKLESRSPEGSVFRHLIDKS